MFLIGKAMTDGAQVALRDPEADQQKQAQHGSQPECDPPQEIKQDPLNHFRSMRPALRLGKLR